MADPKRPRDVRVDARELQKQEQEIAAWIQLREERGEAFMTGARATGDLEVYRDAVIVDVGCGPRPFVEYFPGRLAVMFDCCMCGYRERGLLQDSSLEKALCVDGMAERLPFRDATVDHVFALNMLDHTFSPERVTRELGRVLKPGGCVHLHVDVGGEPTACEPVVFSRQDVEGFFPGFHLDFAGEAEPSNPGRTAMMRRVLRKPGPRSLQPGLPPAAPAASGARLALEAPPALDAAGVEILACPSCGSGLAPVDSGLVCRACRDVYPWRDGILVLLPKAKRGEGDVDVDGHGTYRQ